jgi:hypothetical protein
MSTYSANAIPITPVVYSSEVKYISSFRYAVNDFDINNQITFRILLLDQNGQSLDVRQVELGGCDYANWGNDDTYLINYISSKLGFTPGTIQSSNVLLCPLHITDTSNNNYNIVKLKYDSSMNIILPNNYTRDSSNNIIDANRNIVNYQFLIYNNDGVASVYGSVNIDENNNPLLPVGGYIDQDGYAKDSAGEHIVMVSPL